MNKWIDKEEGCVWWKRFSI